MDLVYDLSNSGLHCAAHEAEFHSKVPQRYNCCEELYDPDSLYEWRLPFQPQE